MKNEFYDTAFRKKIYSSIEELQLDIDNWLKEYNQLRPHSGKHCYGKTPMQTFMESKAVAIEKQLDHLTGIEQNKEQLDEIERASLDACSTAVSIAPHKGADNAVAYYGANRREHKVENDLSGSFL